MSYDELNKNISNFSIDELNNILIDYNNDLISGEILRCIKLIIYEIEYRRLSRFVKNDVDLKILIEYNYDILWKINNDEIIASFNFFDKNKIVINQIIRWVPIFLSINRVYTIYKKFKNIGYSDDKIFGELILNIRIYLDDDYNINDEYLNDIEFIEFIFKAVNMVNVRLKDTYIYKKMMDNLIDENSYALDYLS